MQTMLLPQRLLSSFGRRFPNAWKDADRARSMRGKELPDWPSQVFLPIQAWLTLAQSYGFSPQNLEMITDIMQLASFAAWRPGQDIVRFDADIYEAVASTPLAGDLPSEIFWRLPAWAVYVETPDFAMSGKAWAGFIARLDMRDKQTSCLRLNFLAEDDSLEIGLILGQHSLMEAFSRFFANIRPHLGDLSPEDQFDRKAIEKAVNLVLYLCANGFSDQSQSYVSASYPQAKKVKSGWRLFPPEKPRIWNLGHEIGSKIRMAKGMEHTHGSPRPHIRRAHWHGYWTGPKRGIFALRWLAPIAVAMGEDDD